MDRRKKYENIAGWLDRQEKQKDGWMDIKIDGWIKNEIDGWMDKQQMDGWMDRNKIYS